MPTKTADEAVDYRNMHSRKLENDEPPSTAIVRAVAALTDTPVTELDPLAQSVDPDAINSILTHRGEPCIMFDYCDLLIKVNKNQIIIENAGDETETS